MPMRQLRQQRNSIITTVIFGAIILTFVLWGGFNSDMGSPTSLTTVNGEEIPYADFQRQVSRQLEIYGQAMGGGKPLNEQLVKLIERQVISSLIMETIMAQRAHDLGVVIGDQELLALLQENKSFHDPEKQRFSPQMYKAVLEANNLNPTQFEKNIRKSLAGDRLRELLEASLWTSEAEIQEAARLQNQSMTLDIAIFDSAKAKPQNLSEAEIKTYFESHRGEFMSSSKRKGVVASISPFDVESKITVTEDQIRSFYEAQVKGSSDKKWTTPQAHAYHILISNTAASGLSKAQKLKAEITSGPSSQTFEKFKAKAATVSEDYSNASKGGDLGYFDESAMVKPFSQAVFKTAKLGSVVGPVKTDYGYHLIYVTDLTGNSTTLEARQKQIGRELRAQKLLQEMTALREKVQKAATSSLSSSESALKALGLQWQTVGPVDLQTRQENLPFMVLQDFMQQSLNKWSEPTEVQGSLYIYRVTEEIAPESQTLEQARSKVVAQLSTEKLESSIQATFAEVSSGKKPWADLKKLGAELTTEKSFKTFQAQQIQAIGESEAALRAAQGLSPEKTFAGPLLQEGKWIILKGSQFSDSAKSLTAEEIKKSREDLVSKKRIQLLTAVQDLWIKNVRIPESFRTKYSL